MIEASWMRAKGTHGIYGFGRLLGRGGSKNGEGSERWQWTEGCRRKCSPRPAVRTKLGYIAGGGGRRECVASNTGSLMTATMLVQAQD